MREGRLRALGVLRSLTPASTDDDADQHRAAHDAAEHVAVLGGQIDDLVHRQEGEIGADMRGDGIVADQRRADGDAGHALFHERHVEHALGPVFLGEVRRRAEDALKVVDSLAHDEGVGIPGEGGIHRLEQGASVGQDPCLGGRRFGRGNGHGQRLRNIR